MIIYRDCNLDINKDFMKNVSEHIGDEYDAEPIKEGNTIIGWKIIERINKEQACE